MAYTYEYPRPAVTVDCLITRRRNDREPEILLIKRREEPYRDKWALPGGFIRMNETLQEAALRELKEETGLSVSRLKQLHAFDEIGRDPRHRTISIVFIGRTAGEDERLKASSDAREAGWFPLSEIPELAFDHEKIIHMSIKRNAL